MGIVGIEQILTALVVLHMEGTERTVQFLGSHPEFLGYLSGGETGDGVEHIVGIESLRHQSVDIPFERENLLGTLLDFHHLLPHLLVELPDALILFGDEFRLLLDGTPQHIFGVSEDAFRLLAQLLLGVTLVHRNITARLAYLGQHHGGNPEFESLGTFLFGTEDEGVESILIHEDHQSVLNHFSAVAIAHPDLGGDTVFHCIMFVNVLIYSLIGSAIPKRIANILTTEKRFPLFIKYRTYLTKLRIIEYHHMNGIVELHGQTAASNKMIFCHKLY